MSELAARIAQLSPKKRALLELRRQGAAGVDMGRNIFQSDAPAAMLQAVRATVHDELPTNASGKVDRLALKELGEPSHA